MKKMFKNVKLDAKSWFYAFVIAFRASKKTTQDALSERNYLSILTKEERKEWFSRVYDSYAKHEYFALKCKLLRKALEKIVNEKAA